MDCKEFKVSKFVPCGLMTELALLNTTREENSYFTIFSDHVNKKIKLNDP